jgi:pimeloyl-ACP methyl ester carboxylesterase
VRKLVAMALMLAVVLGAQYMAWRGRSGVAVTSEMLAGNPVDHYHAVGGTGITVLVAHGFAANKEVMKPWGYYLAQRGFETYILDEPGHGASPKRLPAWRGDGDNALGENLRAVMDDLVGSKRATPGQIALVGHSMGGAAVTQAALADDRVKATVAISSAYGQEIPATRPGNLLSLAATNDPVSMVKAVTVLATRADSGKGELGKQSGSFAEGTARESDLIPGRNHLTILYDEAVMDRTARWIGQSLGAGEPKAANEAVFGWLWVWAALLGALGFVLAVGNLVAPAESRRGGRNPSRVGFLAGLMMVAVAALSAVLATVYLRIPWPPLAVADYLLPYFLVMAAVMLLLRLVWPQDFGYPLTDEQNVLMSLVRGLGVFLAFAGAVGVVVQMSLSNFIPAGARVVPLVTVSAVFFLYFVQEEALKRAVAANRGLWASVLLGLFGKVVVVGTWFGAMALPNPQPFLPLIAPVILALLVVTELFSALLARWRYSAVATATLTALVLGWTVAVTFPLT